MNELLFENLEGLTFDDVLTVPNYSEVLPSHVDTRSHLTRDIFLNIPIVSAAMDTITEARLAISIAREGGIGIIHRNFSIEEQAAEVDRVKRSEAGMITDPITLPPTAKLAEADAIMAKYHISGIPIVDPDTNRLVGIFTNRDFRFASGHDLSKPVLEYMTHDNLVTATVGTTLEEAKNILQQHRIEKLPLVNESFELIGLITVKDIQKKIDYPHAAKDGKGRLLVGAAIGVGQDLEARVRALVKAGVDVVVIDTAHGDSLGVINAVKRVKNQWPGLPVVAGNVVTGEGTQRLIEAGADAVKVGVGAGSICTTRVIAGTGVPQMTAIYQCARVGKAYGIPIIADGGIKYSGDIVKAIAAGADCVMLGSMMAGLDEAPGEVITFEGRQFKEYRGMGSMAAMQGHGKDRYGSGQTPGSKLVPEGVEGIVPYKGKLQDFIFQLVGGLRSGMGYVGARNINELKENTRLIKITHAGLIESHPHDITILREAPNYQSKK
ncbi:MAG: IMP dehydrogenase [Anaerolineae bacterium]|nr:IMP dehydrogenase [Anaerolineae bacterium]